MGGDESGGQAVAGKQYHYFMPSLVPEYIACAPRVPLMLCLVLRCLETEGHANFQGRAGITSIVLWILRPVMFGVELL